MRSKKSLLLFVLAGSLATLGGCSLLDPSTEKSPISDKPLTKEELQGEFATWAEEQETAIETERKVREADLEAAALAQAAAVEAKQREFQDAQLLEEGAAKKRDAAFRNAIFLVEDNARAASEEAAREARRAVGNLSLEYDMGVTDSERTLARLAASVDAAAREATAQIERLTAQARRDDAKRVAETNTAIQNKAREVNASISSIDRQDERRSTFLKMINMGADAANGSGIPILTTIGSVLGLAGTLGAGLWGKAKSNQAKEAMAKEQETKIGAGLIVDSIDMIKAKDQAVRTAFKVHGEEIKQWQGVHGTNLVTQLQSPDLARS